jgi:hypothetical protein
MKLLFDENLSPKLPLLVAATFPDSKHIRELGLKGHADEEIWNYAEANGFTAISKDKDFTNAHCSTVRRRNLSGSPWATARVTICWRLSSGMNGKFLLLKLRRNPCWFYREAAKFYFNLRRNSAHAFVTSGELKMAETMQTRLAPGS